MSEPVFVHPSAIVDDGAVIGPGTKIWHFCHVSGTARIGAGCVLGQNVYVGPDAVLGANCRVQNNVSVYQGVVCEEDVFLGPSVVFTNVLNPRSFVDRKAQLAQTRVQRGATIGANATIVCGVELGAYAFVGAGAVVTTDVAAFALVVGNPATPIGFMSRRGVRLHFDQAGLAVCEESGERYLLCERHVTHLG